MTLISEIKLFFAGTKTKLEKFEAAFVKLFAKAPTVLQAVENFIAESAPVIEGIDAFAAPATEPELAEALDTVEVGLATLASAIKDVGSATTITQALANLNADVPALLAAVDVKNAALVSKVQGVVTYVTSELAALIPVVEKWVATLTASPAAA